MGEPINNSQDLIDSRDVIARIKELEETENRDDEENDELAALKALADEGENVADWIPGATLIRKSHFEDYAREFAEDIGAIGRDAGWPTDHIDWPAAADALKMDYTIVDFDGVEYFAHS